MATTPHLAVADVHSRGVGEEVSVLGIVHWASESKAVQTWNGGRVRKMDVEICDASWPVALLVTFWGVVEKPEVGTVIKVTGKISEWRGRSLNVRKNYVVVQEPKLKRWYYSPGTRTALNRAAKAMGTPRRGVVSLDDVCKRGGGKKKRVQGPRQKRRHDPEEIERAGRLIAAEIFRRPKKLPGAAVTVLGEMALMPRGDVEREARRVARGGKVKAGAVGHFVARTCAAKTKGSWGTTKNAALVEKAISRWLSDRDVGDSLDLGDLVTKLDVSKLVFFPSTVRINAQQHQAQRAVAEEWIAWVAELAVETCRRYFVATRSGDAIIYQGAAAWRQREIRTARRSNFLTEVAPVRGAWRGRLEPKANDGARLVQVATYKKRENNCSLKDVKHALTFEAKRNSAVGFGGTAGFDRLFRTLRSAKKGGHALQPVTNSQEQRHLLPTPPLEKIEYHLATFDVARCFDGMDQSRLFTIASETLREPAYYVHLGKRGRAVAASDHDKPKRSRLVKRTDLLAELKTFIFSHYLRISRRRYFHQIRGIPQGACVSSVLCDLYYGDFERRHLPNVDDARVVRVVDDTFALSRSAAPLSNLITAYATAPDDVVRLNPKKTRTTFPRSATEVPSEKAVTFMGLRIRRDLSVTASSQRRRAPQRTVPVPSSRHTIDVVLRGCLPNRMHPLFFDKLLHSRTAALANLRDAFDDAAALVLPLWSPGTNPSAARSQVHALVRTAYSHYRRSHRKFNLDRRLHLRDFYSQAYAAFTPWLLLPTDASSSLVGTPGSSS